MSFFSRRKGERDKKGIHRPDGEIKLDKAVVRAGSSEDTISALGHGMLITGNIVCAGGMQVFGRIMGDVHAAKLIIGEGGHVEGNIIAQDTVIYGVFKGTIHANSVSLQSTAMVDGEILSGSLTIEQNARFEGVSRKLEKPVDPPTSGQAVGERGMADVVPISGAVG